MALLAQAAIKCHKTADWVKILPVVLLGLRNAYKEDIKTSTAELLLCGTTLRALLYGTQLRIPGEYFTHEEPSQDPFPFLEHLRQAMRNLRPTQTAHHNKPRIFAHKALHDCTHVFVRIDGVKKPLDQPYEGPYEVLERISNFCYRINIKEWPTDVSTDRLKPAYLETTADNPPPRDSNSQPPPSEQSLGHQQNCPDRGDGTSTGTRTYPAARTTHKQVRFRSLNQLAQGGVL